MRIIKTLVVDDEPFARKRIVKLLEGFDCVSVIGESKNGKEAITQIDNYKPDLVFLDIEMPDLTGFDVLAKSDKENQPFIIFVTAYDQYALKAFDVKAVDYLLKPYDDERFAQALEHAKQQILQRDEAKLHKQMLGLLDGHRQQQSDTKFQIEVKDKGRKQIINTVDIYFLEAQGNYIKLHLNNKKYLLRETLYGIKKSLDKNVFLQIHRSILINCNYIENIRYIGNNQYEVKLKDKTTLQSSRSFKESIQAYVSQ